MKRLMLIGLSIVFFMGTNSLFAMCGKINGKVSYPGHCTGKVTIAAVRIPPVGDQMYYLKTIPEPGSYCFEDIPDGIYLVTAYINTDNIEGPNPGEPVGVYPQLIILANGNSVENADITLIQLPASTGTISGDIIYEGEITGPVKVVSIGISPTPFNHTVVDLTKDGNVFSLNSLNTGQYIVFGYMDSNRDGFPGLDEPWGAVLDFLKVDASGAPTQTTLQLGQLSNFSGAVSGKLTYSGTQSGPILVNAVGLSYTPFVQSVCNSEDLTYKISDLAPGDYGIIAFMDVNGNGQPNNSEPMGYFPKNFITVRDGQTTPEIDFELKDAVEGTGWIDGTIGIASQLQDDFDCSDIYVMALGVSESPIRMTHLSELGDFRLTGFKTGIYTFIAFADLNGDRIFNINEPIGLYKMSPALVMEGIPTVKIEIVLDDLTKTTGSVGGTISYNGNQTGNLQFLGFGLSKTPIVYQKFSSPGAYQLDGLGMGMYVFVSYLDTNGDGFYKPGEPFGIYPMIRTVVNDEVTENTDITITDKGTGSITGTITNPNKNYDNIYFGACGLSSTPIKIGRKSSPGNYELSELNGGFMLVWAFQDNNGDSLPGPDEPFYIHPEIVMVNDGAVTSNINLEIPQQTTDITTANPPLILAGAIQDFRLEQNYPNPFNAETNIKYYLPQSGRVTFSIFNSLGEAIQHTELGTQAAGHHMIHWNGKNNVAQDMPSGVYFYRIKTGNFTAMKKLLLLR